ncbi:hypothetical protein J6590_068098 [Homalodisca vitripennis]|nr:hypothetical protein J6590_068098 [Homalodisca vitripennis]
MLVRNHQRKEIEVLREHLKSVEHKCMDLKNSFRDKTVDATSAWIGESSCYSGRSTVLADCNPGAGSGNADPAQRITSMMEREREGGDAAVLYAVELSLATITDTCCDLSVVSAAAAAAENSGTLQPNTPLDKEPCLNTD